VRGCQQESKANDDVLWAYDALNRQHSCRRVRILISALVQELGPLVFRNRLYVRDGLSGDPVAGAMIGGMVTNAKGEAKVKFKTPGIFMFKASKQGTIRSNALTIAISPRV
jgi:hypothetical protein